MATRRLLASKYFFPILLLLILIAFYWKLTLTKQYNWIWGPDLAQQVLPWLEEESRQLHHSELPLWDPHTWLGQPMLGQAQPGTAYPLNWLLFLVPRVGGHIQQAALQWYFIIIHYMAALFCYMLCRDLRRSRAASLIGGLIFSLAAYVGTTDWPQMINGAVWAPLVLLFELRALRGHRPLVSAALCGTFLGTAWLSGHHQVPIYITLTMGGVWLYHILREGRIDWNIAKLAAVSLVFLFLVGALQILPAQEYGQLAKRWAGADHELTWNEAVPYYVHREYSMPPSSLFAILIPGMNRHADPFVGVVAFSLALFALILCWKNKMVKLFAALAIGALIYSLGHNSVFQGFIYAVVPLVEKARVPSMAVIIWGFGIAVLAAFGADHIAASRESLWTRRAIAGILGFGIVIYALMLNATFINKTWSIDDRVALTALVAILLAALLQAWRSANLTQHAALALLVMLMLLELGNDSGYTFVHTSDKESGSFMAKITNDSDIAEFLHQQPGKFRIETNTETLVANWGSYHNFDIFLALLASVTTNVFSTEFHTWQTRMLFGVKYTLSEKPPLADSINVFTAASGLKVWENPGAFPRAWTSHDVFHIAVPADGRAIINDHLAELRTRAFTLEKTVPLARCDGADTVTIQNYAAEKIILSANMACEGMLIVSDSYFPGWKATVDGKSTGIHEVNMAMRGVVVPAGQHEVVMKYRPASVYLGAFFTFTGWLGAILLVIYGPNTRKDDDNIIDLNS